MIGDRPTQASLERLWRYCDRLEARSDGHMGVDVFDGRFLLTSAGSLLAELQAVMNNWRVDL